MRSLSLTNQKMGSPLSGVWVFIVKPKPGDTGDAMLEQLQREFAEHSCKEDVSQAAARTVKKATS